MKTTNITVGKKYRIRVLAYSMQFQQITVRDLHTNEKEFPDIYLCNGSLYGHSYGFKGTPVETLRLIRESVVSALENFDSDSWEEVKPHKIEENIFLY